jgi:hypothetical protein
MVSRRGFLGMLGLGAIATVFKPEKWIPTPLPPPPVEVADYTRVIVPMAFYSHVCRTTLVGSMVETIDGKNPRDFPGIAEDMARQLADEIDFEIIQGYTPT